MSREYEIKLLAEGSSFAAVVLALKTSLMSQATSYEDGTSIDSYWKPAPGAKGAFIRLRVNNEAVLTAKVNDKNNITDRVEHNVKLHDITDSDSLAEALTSVLGEPTPLLWRFVDFKIGKTGTTISVIQNIEAPTFVFVEVECEWPDQLDKWVQLLKSDGQLTLKQVKNSFYDIFVKRDGILL